MKNWGFLALIIAVGACSTGTGPAFVSTAPIGLAPSASSGFAKTSDSITNVPDGTTFTSAGQKITITGATSSLNVSETAFSTEVVSANRINVTVNGKTYALTYNPSSDEFQGSFGNETVSAFVENQNQYASVGGATIETRDARGALLTTEIVTGIVGFSADPAALPATATYTGSAALTVLKSNGDVDAATGSATLNADFSRGTIDGTMALTDPLGDGGSFGSGTGSVDLGTFTASIGTGQITGSAFSAPVNVAAGDIGAVANPNLRMNGGFYGPVGEHAIGIAIGQATSTDPGASDDLLLIGEVNTTR